MLAARQNAANAIRVRPRVRGSNRRRANTTASNTSAFLDHWVGRIALMANGAWRRIPAKPVNRCACMPVAEAAGSSTPSRPVLRPIAIPLGLQHSDLPRVVAQELGTCQYAGLL